MKTTRQKTFWRLETVKDGKIERTSEFKTKKMATEKACYLCDTGRVDTAQVTKMRMLGIFDPDKQVCDLREDGSRRYETIEWDEPKAMGAQEVFQPRREYSYRTLGFRGTEPQDDDFRYWKTIEDAKFYADQRLKGRAGLTLPAVDSVGIEEFERIIPKVGSVKIADLLVQFNKEGEIEIIQFDADGEVIH
jgi:hypothetical protein